MLCLCVMENCVLSCLKLWNFSMLKMGKLIVNLKYIIQINLNKIVFRFNLIQLMVNLNNFC